METQNVEKDKIKYNKLKVFLTGYLGFMGINENPTETLVKEIIAKKELFNKENIEIINHKIFEVTTDYVDKNIHSFYKEIEHDKEGDVLFLIVHFGLASTISIPKIETTAFNYINDEVKSRPICDSDGKCFLSKLNTECIVNNMNKTHNKKLMCKVSKDAGKYLCNYIFYKSLKYYEKIPNVLVTFIHIPFFEKFSLEQNLELFQKFLDNIKTLYLKEN